MTEEEEIRRGDEAAYITNHALFKEAMEMVKKDVIDKWSAAPARDKEGREWLWMFYQNALKFEEVFQTVINTGKMARIQQKQSAVERVTSLFG